LESLVLSDNNLDGTSLNNLKKLKNLETLLIDNCRLSGKIPSSLMKLKKLEELDLNDNCLKTKVSKKLKKWLDELNPATRDSNGLPIKSTGINPKGGIKHKTMFCAGQGLQPRRGTFKTNYRDNL
jgi:Leucine-rich repeat (LRR) protein